MRRILLLALPALLVAAEPVSAQPLPGCSPANANERICQAGNICVCRMTGGLLHGIPQAFRWDCGIQNGGCIPGAYNQMTPYAPGAQVGSLPPQRSGSASAPAGGTLTGRGPGKDEVAKVQAALAHLGFDPGPADGVVGPRTRRALQQYLAQQNLPPSDRITPEIYRRLVP
jgi:hypothetical protein